MTAHTAPYALAPADRPPIMSREPRAPLFMTGMSLDIGAISESRLLLDAAFNELTIAHLAGNIGHTKERILEVRKYAFRIGHLCGAMDERIADHLQRKPRT